ncbi:hypothetical protein ACGFYQ_30140 [Streptomyces sp. NPDC048258]|uniref:hypothetical protein n=1 Tax=Streptomyces sp. NPDC048258 TaxID=3365527 RepID=UPI003719995F
MPGNAGVILVIAVELVLMAWKVTGTGAIAVLTALWGVLAAVTDARIAIGIAGVLLLATPFLLPRRDEHQPPATEPEEPVLTTAVSPAGHPGAVADLSARLSSVRSAEDRPGHQNGCVAIAVDRMIRRRRCRVQPAPACPGAGRPLPGVWCGGQRRRWTCRGLAASTSAPTGWAVSTG